MDLYFYTKRKDVAATTLADLAAVIAALAAPTTAANIATLSRVADTIEGMVQSDTGEPLNLYFSPDGTTYEAWSTDATTTLAVGLGLQDPRSADTYASTTSFSIAGNARVGTLSLNTTALRDALEAAIASNPRAYGAHFTLHVRKTSVAGVVETIALLPVFVQAGVLSATVDPDTSAASYPTTAQFVAGSVQNKYAITGLTGGGATALDGQETGTTADQTIPTGAIYKLSYGRVGQEWQLIAGTDAEDVANGVVRPDDYNASTNARIWVQL